eukprot:3843049-Prymnesium_polylepis.1
MGLGSHRAHFEVEFLRGLRVAHVAHAIMPHGQPTELIVAERGVLGFRKSFYRYSTTACDGSMGRLAAVCLAADCLATDCSAADCLAAGCLAAGCLTIR